MEGVFFVMGKGECTHKDVMKEIYLKKVKLISANASGTQELTLQKKKKKNGKLAWSS